MVLNSKKIRSLFRQKTVLPVTGIELVQKLLVITFALVCLVAFIYASVMYYPSTAKRIAQQSIDLTGFQTKIKFGNSPKCEREQECWVQPEFNDKEWSTFVLPRTVIRYAKEYKFGPDIWLYYRIKLKIPEKLMTQKEEIAFSPMYVNHNSYQVFLNGRKVQTGNKVGNSTALLVISIPKEEVQDGYVSIVIKGSMFLNNESGISHRSYWLLGKEHLLRQLYLDQERATSTFHLLFLLSKGGIILIFSIIFIFMTVQRGFLSFLIFAIFSTFENILIAPYLGEILSLQARNNVIFYFKAISMIGFFSFLINYLHFKKVRTLVSITGIVILSIISFFIWKFNFSRSVNIMTLLNVSQIMWLSVLLISILFCFNTLKRIKSDEIKVVRISFYRNIIVVLCVYFTLIMWLSFFTGTYKGFDFKPVVELIFFLYIATETFQGFSFNLQERARMKHSLLEAKKISKLFVPSSAPDWNHIKISTYHKQLEEAGGDWYTFLTSPSGRYRYFIMCDVTGHGVQAALIVSACRSILSSFIKRKDRRKFEGERFITAYIAELNEILYSDGGGYYNTSFFALVFDLETKKVAYINCGHPNAIVLKNTKSDNLDIEPLISHPHSNLGVNPQIDPKLKYTEIGTDEIIIAYTDALLLDRFILKKRYKQPFLDAYKNYFYKNSLSEEDICIDLMNIVKSFQAKNKINIIDKDDTTLVSFYLS